MKPRVNFERFHDMLARQIAGKDIPGLRCLFLYEDMKVEFGDHERQKYIRIVLKMIGQMFDVLNEEIIRIKRGYIDPNTVRVQIEHGSPSTSLINARNTGNIDLADLSIEEFYASDTDDSFDSKTHFDELEDVLRYLIFKRPKTYEYRRAQSLPNLNT